MSINLQASQILNHYFCKIKLPASIDSCNNNANKIKSSNLPTFITILDSSVSMGHHTERICKSILPQIFTSLNYPPETLHHIINFDTYTNHQCLTLKDLQSRPIRSGGCTYIAPTFKKLMDIIKPNMQYRLLVISDGDVYDMSTALQEASSAKTFMKNYNINSQTIRFFSSSSQPDTRALASFLQLNTITKPNLVDISGNLSDNVIATAIANLFRDDTTSYNLTSSVPIFKSQPWLPPTDKITIYNTESTIWLENLPGTMNVNGQEYKIDMVIDGEINEDNVHKILSSELEKFLNYLKLLKVVNNETSKTEIMQIVNYFNNLEHSLFVASSKKNLTDPSIINSLKHRCNIFKTVINRKKKLPTMIKYLN